MGLAPDDKTDDGLRRISFDILWDFFNLHVIVIDIIEKENIPEMQPTLEARKNLMKREMPIGVPAN